VLFIEDDRKDEVGSRRYKSFLVGLARDDRDHCFYQFWTLIFGTLWMRKFWKKEEVILIDRSILTSSTV
jgi:hypothetical protein